MKTKLAVVLAAALLLTGCSGPSEGTIQDKRHAEGYYYTVMQCGSYNAKGGCSVYIPIQHYQPPVWKFDLYGINGEHGWRGVSADTYDRYSVGDYYKETE